MTKVYVVQEGDYSDRHIVSIFSTQEKADRFVMHFNEGKGYDPFDIQEYTLDPIDDKVYIENLHRYMVFMEKDGKANVRTYDYDFNEEPPYFLNNKDQPEYLRIFCWARDEEHAIKIANEKRSVILAYGLWMNNEMVKNI